MTTEKVEGARRGRPKLIDPVERRCYACKATKPISEFYTSKNGTAGYHHSCKTCNKTAASKATLRRMLRTRPARFRERLEDHKRLVVWMEEILTKEGARNGDTEEPARQATGPSTGRD